MKTIIILVIVAVASAIPTPVIVDLQHIMEDEKRPIEIPKGAKKTFCKNWIAEGPDELEIISNGNSKPFYTNTEYGFSSIWSKLPVENPKLTISKTDISIREFINMMSWNEFIYLPITWKFSNCIPYKDMMKLVKSEMISTFQTIDYTPSEKNLVDAVDTTGCLDDSTCVKRLCFPVDPTNVYNYDQSQVILYNIETRMCYRYTGGNDSERGGNNWYQIIDAGVWE